jgi:hypothetical protein
LPFRLAGRSRYLDAGNVLTPADGGGTVLVTRRTHPVKAAGFGGSGGLRWLAGLFPPVPGE